MSNRKAIVLFLILLVLLIFSAMLSTTDRRQINPVSSSYSAFPRGLKGLFLYLSESGIPTSRWLRNPVDLPASTSQLLIISDPSQVLISSEESHQLLNWVSRGNSLLFASRCGEGLTSSGLDSRFLEVLKISCKSSAQGLESQLNVHRLFAIPVSTSRVNDHVRMVSTKHLSLAQISAVESISLLTLGKKPAAFLRGYKKGNILFLPSSSILENSEINQVDNLQFVYNFVRYSGTRTVLFDEYYHGFYEFFSAPSIRKLKVLSRTSLELIALLVLFLLMGGKRLGPARLRLIRKGRSALETTDSLSALYLKAGKYRYLCRSLQQSLRILMQKKYHLALDKGSSGWEQIADVLQAKNLEMGDLKEILELEIPDQVTENFFLKYAKKVDFWRTKLGASS